MATTNIGQYRYAGASSNCITNIKVQKRHVDSSIDITGLDEQNTGFKDVAIIPEGDAFSKGQDYYLKVTIPQDMNYAMEFTIKLVKNTNTDQGAYQYIRTVKVNAGGNGTNVYNVALYEKKDGSINAMIPLKYGQSNINGALYYREQDKKYYLGTGGTQYEQTDKRNIVALTASWKTDVSERYGLFEMIFRPIEDGFVALVLSMTRQSEDYNIQHTTGNGTTYGRILDLEKTTCELYKVNNLVGSMNSNANLDRIGVWGHSGLMMAINGEEIKIGPSGFYELSEVPVSSLGVVARDFNDSFTVDYEFSNKNVEEVGE